VNGGAAMTDQSMVRTLRPDRRKVSPQFVGDSGEQRELHPVHEIESISTHPMALPFIHDSEANDGDAQARRQCRGLPERGGDRCGRLKPLGGRAPGGR
jgi:hypothetical protein